MLAFFCLGARYRPWRYSAAVRSRVFGDGAAPRRTRCSSQPRQHSVFRASGGAFSKSCLRCRFFLRGGRQLFGAGRIQAFVHGKIFTNTFSGDWQWQYSATVRSRALADGKMPAKCVPPASDGDKVLARCVPERFAVARFRRGAFPGGNPWQVLRSMYPERGLGRENRPFPARFARHVSEKPRKPPSEDTPREYPARKGPFSLHGPLESCIVRRSCHPASPNRPSARNPGAAEQCEPPELDRPTQETQPRRQRPRRLLGSKYRQQPPRYRHRSLPTPASSLSPRRTTLSSPTAPPVETTSTPPPPRRFAELRSPKGRATFPTCGACLLCSWQMRSVCKRQTEPLLRDYFVMVA